VGAITLWTYPLEEVIKYSSPHFLFSAYVGYAVYYLTSTMLWRYNYVWTRKELLGLSTFQFSWLLAVSCAVFVHYLEDYVLNWF